MAQVIWTKKALSQLERSVKYIVEEQGSSYAEIVLNKILASTRNLIDFPKMGQWSQYPESSILLKIRKKYLHK